MSIKRKKIVNAFLLKGPCESSSVFLVAELQQLAIAKGSKWMDSLNWEDGETEDRRNAYRIHTIVDV
jgi:hypothetical protein